MNIGFWLLNFRNTFWVRPFEIGKRPSFIILPMPITPIPLLSRTLVLELPWAELCSWGKRKIKTKSRIIVIIVILKARPTVGLWWWAMLYFLKSSNWYIGLLLGKSLFIHVFICIPMFLFWITVNLEIYFKVEWILHKLFEDILTLKFLNDFVWSKICIHISLKKRKMHELFIYVHIHLRR